MLVIVQLRLAIVKGRGFLLEISLLVLLEGNRGSLDPLLDDLAVQVNKDESLIIHVILFVRGLVLLVQLFLARLLVTVGAVEVLNLCLDLAVTLSQLDFEDVDYLLALERGGILALEHSRSRELSLSNISDLSHGNDN